ncbi:MAG: hypothetical protein RBS99_00415 [Rhodospirillales bacterium]|jgi:hypothetical protein|nr:hypothetical protein [Rhodospirillales bacterium]
MTPLSLSSWVAVFVFVLTIVDHFLGVAAVGYVPVALLVLFVLLEVRRAPRAEIAAACVLTAGGLAAAWLGGDPGYTIVSGIHRTQPFFLLFAAIAWLREPASASPSLRAAQEFALGQPAGRRFPVLISVAHALGSVLNLAGISLLAGVLQHAGSENTRHRFTRALTQGFTAAACWTPFFVAMSVGLSVVPGLAWSEVAPFGLAAALMLTVLSWAMDRLFYRRCEPAVAASAPARPTRRFEWRMVAVPASLFVIVIGLIEAWAMPIPVALGLVTPVYAAVWTSALAMGRASPAQAVGGLARRVAGGLPGLRGEILLFLAANLFGSGVAAALPPELVGRTLDAAALSPDALIVVVLFGILLLALIGLHPLVPVVVIGQVLPPALLGLPPAVFCALLVTIWGISTTVSPFSGTTLFMRRVGGLPAWRIAWVVNGPYGVAGTVLLAAVVLLTRRLGIL